MINNQEIVFSDIDGTLLNSDFKLSERNLQAMHKLKDNGYLIGLATGRNLYSSRKVLSDDLPIDYLIFSTGVGIQDFRTKEIFYSYRISAEQSRVAVELLKEMQQNFFVHFTAPDNHKFYFNHANNECDFRERFKIYEEFAYEMPEQIDIDISQIVIVLPNNLNLFEKVYQVLKKELPDLSYIRATSPLNHSNIWLEVYPTNVSKGYAMRTLCNYLNIDLKNSFAIGNDYNDMEMLQMANYAYVVSNSPDELKLKYQIVGSNDQDGFAQMVEMILR